MIQLEMKQSTVGNVTHDGVTYDIDWMFRTDKDGTVIECEGFAFVFIGDDQIIDFCQPDWSKDGWESINDLMADAALFIRGGILDARLKEINS